MKLSIALKISFISALLFLTNQAFAQTEETTTSAPTESVSTEKPDVTAKTPEDDAKITETLTKLIKHSKVLSKLNVKVSTEKGVVSLVGEVDSDTEASSLVEHAESIIGVSDVDTSKLTVKSSKHPFADTMITAKIKGLLVREKLFGEKDVAAINTSVETTDGVVYLSGVLDNKDQINNAIAIIKKNIPEVKKVEYKVKVTQ